MADLNNKDRHEKYLVNLFLHQYNKLTLNRINFNRLGNPLKKEPDVICSNDILIEIVDIYKNERQAQRYLSDYNYSKRKKLPKQLPKTLNTLKKEIGKKVIKLNNGNYDGLGKQKEFFLLCVLMDPYITDISVKNLTETHKESHITNKEHNRSFHQIWIMWKSDISDMYKIIRLE